MENARTENTGLSINQSVNVFLFARGQKTDNTVSLVLHMHRTKKRSNGKLKQNRRAVQNQNP